MLLRSEGSGCLIHRVQAGMSPLSSPPRRASPTSTRAKELFARGAAAGKCICDLKTRLVPAISRGRAPTVRQRSRGLREVLSPFLALASCPAERRGWRQVPELLCLSRPRWSLVRTESGWASAALVRVAYRLRRVVAGSCFVPFSRG